MKVLPLTSPLQGVVSLPGDKSMSQAAAGQDGLKRRGLGADRDVRQYDDLSARIHPCHLVEARQGHHGIAEAAEPENHDALARRRAAVHPTMQR